MKRRPRILVVDDEPSILIVLSTVLSKNGYEAVTAQNGLEAETLLGQHDFSAVITDLNMPGKDGLGLLKSIMQLGLELPVVVMSAYGSSESALAATKAGAFDYVFKPFQPDEILFSLRKAEEHSRLKRENRALKEAACGLSSGGMIYKSKVMADLMSLARRVAESDGTVLITGESGSGKELLARAIHEASGRADQTFMAVNCGAIAESILESELFGHVRGAFTNAIKDRAGLFRAASGGTLFLDEIGELPFNVQVKLLRAIQFSEVKPVGGEATIKVDVRLISATARDLAALVKENVFREDLFYRLNVLPLTLPPLRKRPEDIPLLVDHFLKICSRKAGWPRPELAPGFLEALATYEWPGNVRELENLMERLCIISGNQKALGPDDLPVQFKASGRTAASEAPLDLDLKAALKDLEARYIKAALERSHGNRSEAGRLLGLSYPSLLSKIKQYALD